MVLEAHLDVRDVMYLATNRPFKAWCTIGGIWFMMGWGSYSIKVQIFLLCDREANRDRV